ncbi:hypothetical protein CR513_15790, partial [Mucuna pruriens]
MSSGTRRMAILQDPLPTTLEIHLMGCRRDGTPKTLPMRSRNSRTLVQRQFGSRPKSKRGFKGPTPDLREFPPPFVTHKQASQSEEKWQSLEECLCAIEEGDKYGLEVVDLCLVSDVGLPANFKTPKFDKYKGSSCPRVHLAMCCRKMAAYIYDDKVLIHYFQDSLTEAALTWSEGVKTWRDLAEAFLKQYKYNEDMAPDRSRVQNMVKKEQEGFKEYAQRWRELAA